MNLLTIPNKFVSTNVPYTDVCMKIKYYLDGKYTSITDAIVAK